MKSSPTITETTVILVIAPLAQERNKNKKRKRGATFIGPESDLVRERSVRQISEWQHSERLLENRNYTHSLKLQMPPISIQGHICFRKTIMHLLVGITVSFIAV